MRSSGQLAQNLLLFAVSNSAIRVFGITNEAVEREPILQQSLQRFPALTLGAVHTTSGIIAVANEGSVIAFTLSLPSKSQSPVMLAKRASACVDLCFTSASGKLAVAHQDGFIYVYKVHKHTYISSHGWALNSIVRLMPEPPACTRVFAASAHMTHHWSRCVRCCKRMILLQQMKPVRTVLCCSMTL